MTNTRCHAQSSNREWRSGAGRSSVHYYGQTECPLAITVFRPKDHEEDLLGACGKPRPDVEIRLVNKHGDDVPDGEPGETAVRAPAMMAGYHNAPAFNEETFMDRGWLLTSDIANPDQRGLPYMKNRTSDIIIAGSDNVYLREEEDVLIAHPAVAECAVIGLTDPRMANRKRCLPATGAIALTSLNGPEKHLDSKHE